MKDDWTKYDKEKIKYYELCIEKEKKLSPYFESDDFGIGLCINKSDLTRTINVLEASSVSEEDWHIKDILLKFKIAHGHDGRFCFISKVNR